MYDYTGTPCSVCHQAFQNGDDIVVCPDCGAPYHRSCYEQAGGCVYSAKHADGFTWDPPYKAPTSRTCAHCGTENPLDNTYCKKCGAPMQANANGNTPPRAGTQYTSRANANAQSTFDYESFYRTPYQSTYTPAGTIDPNETMEGIPAAEWASYIGPSSRTYLNVFKQMEIMHRKYAISFSAMLFGPFYFFYRKAWKPAFLFLAAEFVVSIPTLLAFLQTSGSTLIPALSSSTLSILSTVASIASLVLMVVRGLFGFYFYKKSAAERIHRIREQYPDPEKRCFVLNAQGGISIAAVIGVFLLLMLLGSLFTLLLGPDLDAVFAAFYA